MSAAAGPGRPPHSIPGPVLRLSVIVAAGLLVPLVIAYLVAGATPALAVGLGYTGALAPALAVPARFALALTVPAAMTGAVAASVNGQAFAAACFVALACLLIAPANALSNGLMAGLPTIASVLAANPMDSDPLEVAAWMLLGGVVVVGLLTRLRTPGGAPEGVDAWTAWVHAVAMAAMVGLIVAVLNVVDVPHGYWIAATMSVVLRPQRGETTAAARERVIGTILGAALGMAVALLVPGWLALALAGGMLVLVVANAALGRGAQQVLYLTPLIILLGSGGGGGLVGAALDRVVMTVVGAALAGIVALWIARVTRQHEAVAGPGARSDSAG